MIRCLPYLFVPLTITSSSQGAPDDPAETRARWSEISVAYHGDLVTHPGFTARGAWPISRSQAAEIALEAQGTTWWHPGNMTAVQARGGLSGRFLTEGGRSWGGFAHLGVQRGFWTSATYRVEDGVVKKLPLAGRNWFVVTPGLEYAQDLSTPALDRWFVRPQVGFRVPTFHGFGLDAALEVGVTLGGGR